MEVSLVNFISQVVSFMNPKNVTFLHQPARPVSPAFSARPAFPRCRARSPTGSVGAEAFGAVLPHLDPVGRSTHTCPSAGNARRNLKRLKNPIPQSRFEVLRVRGFLLRGGFDPCCGGPKVSWFIGGPSGIIQREMNISLNI